MNKMKTWFQALGLSLVVAVAVGLVWFVVIYLFLELYHFISIQVRY